MQDSILPERPNHAFAFDDAFIEEMTFMLDVIFSGNSDSFGEMTQQLRRALHLMDKDWPVISKKLTKPKLSTYGYRTFKFFSSLQLENTQNESPDLRLIFKYSQKLNCLYFLSVGIRVDKSNNNYLPKAHDIYERTNRLNLPEERL